MGVVAVVVVTTTTAEISITTTSCCDGYLSQHNPRFCSWPSVICHASDLSIVMPRNTTDKYVDDNCIVILVRNAQSKEGELDHIILQSGLTEII